MSQLILMAFDKVRDGRSSEFVICDPETNASFLATCRQMGLGVVAVSDSQINQRLSNARKHGDLKSHKTTRRKMRDPNLTKYRGAVENTVRLVERQFQKTVDDIICDVHLRTHFDSLVEFLSPGVPPLESRYCALTLRKTKQLQPEPVGRIIRAVSHRVLKLEAVEDQLDQVPTGPGLYIFFDEESTLYAGKAKNLRNRIGDHVQQWHYRDLIASIRKGNRSPVFLVYHELPIQITAYDLAAYETEVIRSRDPQHNRAGKP